MRHPFESWWMVYPCDPHRCFRISMSPTLRNARSGCSLFETPFMANKNALHARIRSRCLNTATITKLLRARRPLPGFVRLSSKAIVCIHNFCRPLNYADMFRFLSLHDANDRVVTQRNVYVQTALTDRHIHRPHRLPQRKRRTHMIQTTRRIHHMRIKHRRHLVRMLTVHRPHRPNHQTTSSKLHRRREMDRLLRTLFVPDDRVTSGEVRHVKSH